jgi:hypothetical protein
MRQTATLGRVLLLAAGLPLAALIAACGGGGADKVAVEDWVDSLCEVAADFDKARDNTGTAFEEVDFTDTKAAKEAYAKAIGEQKDVQKDFRAAFARIGEPDIKGGDKVVKAFQEQFKENDAKTDEVGDLVADIDDKDDFVEEFLKIIEKIEEPDFRGRLEKVADDYPDVDELIGLIDDDPDCARVIFSQEEAATVEPEPAPTRTTSTGPAVTTNEKWVAGICTALTGWVADLESANTALQSKIDGAASAADLKKLLVAFLKDGQAETVNLRREVAALKAPDVKGGEAIHKIFVDATVDLVKVFDNLVAEAERLDASSLAKVTEDLDRFIQGVDSAFDEVAQSFDALDQHDPQGLDELFQTRPECQGL